MTNTAIPTREIMWNLESVFNPIAMYLLLIISILIFANGVKERFRLWFPKGMPAELYKHLYDKFKNFTFDVLFQKKVSRDRSGGFFHFLIYSGFLVLLFTTTMVMIDHDFGIKIYQGNFYLLVTLFSDVFGLALFIGVCIAAHRRMIKKPDRIHTKAADFITLIVLATLVVQGFILEGLRIHATKDPWANYSPIGLLFANCFWPISEQSTRLIHFIMWWFHTITVFAAIALTPYTKFFHIFASSLNLIVADKSRPKGQLEQIGDIEKLLETNDEVNFGLGTIKDYSWKNLLDLDACTSCGRCQEVCPAYVSGKPLSPKWMILDTRNHALAVKSDSSNQEMNVSQKFDGFLLRNLLLDKSGLYSEGEHYNANGAYRANNNLVSNAVITLGNPKSRIASEVMNSDVFWSCTTCMACVEACPVGINHVDHIVGNRRNMALMHGEIPQEAQPTLRSLETRGNPYGAAEERMKWAMGLDVPIIKPGEKVDILYWVGCVSAFDQRKQKIAKALVTIMKKSGLSFAVAGNAENCIGDPARRLGEENLFQTLAKQNLELFRSISFKTLVANCPHCFNTIKNEYPEFGNLSAGEQPEIIHHSALLQRLIKEKKIIFKEGESNDDYTFHDPCYLGRYNDEYEAPRNSIKAIKGLKILEMEKSRNKAMCCGAGGGHFWMDLKQGERVNVIRTEQALETGAKKIATACPFCMQMMEDGVKLKNQDGNVVVKDIAEVIAEKLL